MITNKSYIWILGLLIFAFFSATAAYFYSEYIQTRKLNYILAKYDISLSESEGFTVNQTVYYERGAPNMIEAKSGDTALKIEFYPVQASEEAKFFIHEQEALLKGIFIPQLSPYPEQISERIICDQKFHPIRFDHKQGVIYQLFATARLGYGACAESQIAYSAEVGWFYCPQNKSVVKMEVFIPYIQYVADNKVESMLNSFKCK